MIIQTRVRDRVRINGISATFSAAILQNRMEGGEGIEVFVRSIGRSLASAFEQAYGQR